MLLFRDTFVVSVGTAEVVIRCCLNSRKKKKRKKAHNKTHNVCNNLNYLLALMLNVVFINGDTKHLCRHVIRGVLLTFLRIHVQLGFV